MRRIIPLLLCLSLVYAEEETPPQDVPGDEVPEEANEPGPWFTGPLIAPIGVVVPLGNLEVDTYFFYTKFIGVHDSEWNFHGAPAFNTAAPQIFLTAGLTSWMDIQVVPQFVHNWTENQSHSGFGDLPVALDFQLYPSDADDYVPGIKISLVETFPTGKYDHLDPNKFETDLIGAGTYATTFNLVLYKVYPLPKNLFMSMTLSAAYTVGTTFNVNGYNINGGNFDTNGKITPGDGFLGIFSFELALAQRFNFAMDTVWTTTASSRFFGNAGLDEDDELLDITSPSTSQLSFAPALEFAYSENLGFIAGYWFSTLGRNDDAFRSAVCNLYYYY